MNLIYNDHNNFKVIIYLLIHLLKPKFKILYKNFSCIEAGFSLLVYFLQSLLNKTYFKLFSCKDFHVFILNHLKDLKKRWGEHKKTKSFLSDFWNDIPD